MAAVVSYETQCYAGISTSGCTSEDVEEIHSHVRIQINNQRLHVCRNPSTNPAIVPPPHPTHSNVNSSRSALICPLSLGRGERDAGCFGALVNSKVNWIRRRNSHNSVLIIVIDDPAEQTFVKTPHCESNWLLATINRFGPFPKLRAKHSREKVVFDI